MNHTIFSKMKVKQGMSAMVWGAPSDYPQNMELNRNAPAPFDFIHLFVTSKSQLEKIFLQKMELAAPNALVWLSYPKSIKGKKYDINRDILWELLITLGWHPVSIIALDEAWSAMRLEKNQDGKVYEHPTKTPSSKPSKKYTLKTKPTDIDPLSVIAAIPNEKKQADAKILLDIFVKAVGKPPVVWGEKFIGFGTYQYRCASGYNGEIYATGFSVTKQRITLHLYLDEPELQDYLKRLGKTSSGKSCVYINKLADVDLALLAEMIEKAARYDQAISAQD